MISVTRQYNNLQEEVNDARKKIEFWKEKYTNSAQELKDLKEEQQMDRDELLDNVRKQSYDLKFYRKLVRMLMKDEEIARIKMKSEYDDD